MPETFPDGGINPMIGEAHAQPTDNAYAAMPLPQDLRGEAQQVLFRRRLRQRGGRTASRGQRAIARHRSQIAELIQEEPETDLRMTPEFPAIFAEPFEMFIDASAGAEHEGRMADAPVCMSIVTPAHAWNRPGREAWSRKSRKLANGIAVM